MSGDTPTVAPPGHSFIAHRVHGWCSKCPGREIWEELHAWRIRERQIEGGAGEGPDPREQEAG